jgi:hypothetical protein
MRKLILDVALEVAARNPNLDPCHKDFLTVAHAARRARELELDWPALVAARRAVLTMQGALFAAA